MLKEDRLKKVEEEGKKWGDDLSKILSETLERIPRFATVSRLEIKGLHTPEDTRDIDYSGDRFQTLYCYALCAMLYTRFDRLLKKAQMQDALNPEVPKTP